MSIDLVQQLLSLLNQLPSTTVIPNFDKIKPILYTLFAHQTGPGQSLIKHYYVTGHPDTEPVNNDPSEQAYWCRMHLPYFSNVAKRIQQLRNKLVHNEFLDMGLLRRTIEAILEFATKRTHNLTITLLEQLIHICHQIIENESLEQNDIVETQLFHYSIEHTLKLAQKRNGNVSDPLLGQLINICQQIINNNNAKNFIEPVEVVNLTPKPPLPENPIQTLSYWKENGWKEVLKGSRIRIKDGKWTDHLATFKSWAGTVATVYIDNHGKLSLRLSVRVEILPN